MSLTFTEDEILLIGLAVSFTGQVIGLRPITPEAVEALSHSLVELTALADKLIEHLTTTQSNSVCQPGEPTS
jgi:hypothetical protein